MRILPNKLVMFILKETESVYMDTFKEKYRQNITVTIPSKLSPTTQNHVYLGLDHIQWNNKWEKIGFRKKEFVLVGPTPGNPCIIHPPSICLQHEVSFLPLLYYAVFWTNIPSISTCA
ncbi:hypothetical protein V8G54_004875 [Vigna mungo]|uniref:Uncharacterized protein n=1 Tax=Vigna mungo TaxID=3915 RepID=A0AAQ3PEC4_VIGMU